MLRGSSGVPILLLLGCASASDPTASAQKPPPEPKALVCTDVASCEASCAGGDVPSCVTAAKRMHRAPLEADLPRLVRVLERGCDGGRAAACVELANLYGSAPALAQEETKAAVFAERACKLEDAVGCLTVARDELDPAKVKQGGPDPTSSPRVTHALQVARAACDKDDGRACAIYAMTALALSSPPSETARYAARASELLEASCLRGTTEDCLAGAMQIAGPSGAGQPSRVLRLLERGCELDDADSCIQIAAGLQGNDPRKAELYRKACAAGSDEGCMVIGKAEQDGLAAPTDATKGSTLILKGIRIAKARCDLADDAGCRNLAKSLPLGAVPTSEAKTTVAYLEKVCARRAAVLCNDLADAVTHGPAALVDATLAAKLRQRSCEYGYPFACPDPIAKLGIYVPLVAPIVDRRSWLEWAPVPERGAASCDKGFKLPTKAQLETLLEKEGSPRPFAAATTPPGAKLLATEPSKDGEGRVRLDVRGGTFEPADDGAGVGRCVRSVARGTKPRRNVLSLRMSGPNLEHTLKDANGKVVNATTIVRPHESSTLGEVWKRDAVKGPVEVDVDPTVDWPLAARFLREAVKLGLEPGRVFIDAPGR